MEISSQFKKKKNTWEIRLPANSPSLVLFLSVVSLVVVVRGVVGV